MENKNLQHTHRHLTFVFTLLTFCMILIIGSSFIFARYFNESRIQKRDMLREITLITQWIKNDTTFLENYAPKRDIQNPKKFKLWGEERENRNNMRTSFLILDTDKNLVFQRQLEEPEFEEVNFSSFKIYKDTWTYVSVRDISGGSIIFYQSIRYWQDDGLRDFLLLLILVSIISWWIYFIWYKFVWKALRPVRENMRDMSDFIHNAGHELKTPLAVIRGNLQIMQAEWKPDKDLTKKSIGQIDTANQLIEWLIELSQVWKISNQMTLNLPDEIKKIFEEFDSLAKQKGVKLHWIFAEEFMIHANREELDILISNLIKNAILYNKPGGNVSVSMKKNVLTILDTWVWISKENQKKIFQRLYRVWSVRSSEGFWIGLSLVEKIASANGWKIELSSEIWTGTKFKITF